MDVAQYLTPTGFARAWSSEVPGPLEQPGPRQSPVPGAVEVVPATRTAGQGEQWIPLASMLRAVWWTDGFHPRPATGRPGNVRKRGVPSAGGCYPVQLHALCGEGCDVPPGEYVVNTSTGGLLRVNTFDAGWRWGPLAAAPGEGAVVVLTVLPQRTAAKYHHRAGPLLVADTAYAATALVHHAAARCMAAEWEILMPHDVPGFPEETALARISLNGRPPAGVPEDIGWPGVSQEQLARRRSADAFLPRPDAGEYGLRDAVDVLGMLKHLPDGPLPPKPLGCRTRILHGGALQDPDLAGHCAGQHWIGNLDALLLFETISPPQIDAMWWASSTAAHLLYSAVGAGAGIDFRPVGGWTGTMNGWTTLHGLGLLRRATQTTEERATHAGQ